MSARSPEGTSCRRQRTRHRQTRGAPPEDPFFEDLQRPNGGDETSTPALDGERAASTTAFFDQLGSQSPAEMSETVAPEAPRATLPGSARLPAELELRRERRFRRRDRVRSLAVSRLRLGPAIGLRLAWPPAAAAAAVLLVASVTLAAILVSGRQGRPEARRAAALPPILPRTAEQSTQARHTAKRAKTGPPRHSAPRGATHRRNRRPSTRKPTVTLAADRAPAVTSSASPPTSTATPVSQTAAVTQASTTAPAQTSSTPTSTAASSSTSNPPAFGANGTLGPGHSPNG
jgi:hypothetical protein